jgi:zinc finger protein 830
MADVRALLQSERVRRRITHPHATYTSDGKLLCNLCTTVVKSEAQWQSHLHSTQHNLRSQRAQDAKELRGVGESGVGKKRKAETLDSPRPVDKKRARSDDDDEAEVEEVVSKAKENGRPKKMVKFESPVVSPSPLPSSITPTLAQNDEEVADIDESELQALEADLAALEESTRTAALDALRSEATISAPAMTAEELAAQAREEQSSQKGRRDREIEDEREEAEGRLEDEFAEMEGFETRVKRLRERREALRVVSPEVEGVGLDEEVGGGGKEEVVDESSEEDEEDGWKFGGS